DQREDICFANEPRMKAEGRACLRHAATGLLSLCLLSSVLCSLSSDEVLPDWPCPISPNRSTLALPTSRAKRIGANVQGGTRMCGIVGYIGNQEAEPILIEGLRRLEYRGYDS